MTKYRRRNSIKLNNFSQDGSFKLLLHLQALLDSPMSFSSIIDCNYIKGSLSPHPLPSHAFDAMHSIMLEMVSVGQGKLACAIRAEMKHLERSYSTLSC